MRRFSLIISAIVVSFLLMAFYSNQPSDKKHEYIGVQKCGMCHKKDKDGAQLKVWEGSDHAKAYKTLQTAEADKIAKEKGFSTKAVETDACLKCHAPAHNVDAKLLGKKFDIADGVQCENCHGAGDGYKSMKVMKDRAQSVENGLIVYENEAAIEKQCKTCHNEESPTYKPFVFAEKYAKIKHDIPKN